MFKAKWTTTKKEFTYDAAGHKKPEKITLEKPQRDVLDLVIKGISALAIFIPLLLIYLQKNTEIGIETSRNRSELYTNILTDIQIIVDEESDSNKFASAYENILYRYNPKIHLIKNDSLNALYSKILSATKFQKFLVEREKLIGRLTIEKNILNNGITFIHYTNKPNLVEIEIDKNTSLDSLKKASIKFISDIHELRSKLIANADSPSSRFFNDTIPKVSIHLENEVSHLKNFLILKDDKEKNKFLGLTNSRDSNGDLNQIAQSFHRELINNTASINILEVFFEEILKSEL